MRQLSAPRISTALAIAVLTTTSAPQVADAAEDWTAEPVRYWPISQEFLPSITDVDASVDGITVLYTVEEFVGADDTACRIAIADGDGAVAHHFRHNFEPTRCIDVTADPDGGVFVRAETAPDGDTDFGDGLTARIDATGELLWAIDDRELVDAEAPSDGPGQFSGDYEGALPGLAYDADSDTLMGLSLGRETLADIERPVFQTHVVDADRGQLEVNGQTFGSPGDEEIAGITARDGEFLVQTVVGDERHPRFYSYRTTGAVERFEPDETDWSSRRLTASVAYRPGLGSFYVWTDERDEQSAAGVTRVEGLDSPQWGQTYEQSVEFDGRHTDVGDAVAVWPGDELAAIEYRRAGERPVLRLVDVNDGTARGAFEPRNVLPHTFVGLGRTDDGALTAIAIDSDDAAVWEFTLRADAHSGDASGENDDSGDNGCSTTASSPDFMWPIALLMGLFALRRRRSIQSL